MKKNKLIFKFFCVLFFVSFLCIAKTNIVNASFYDLENTAKNKFQATSLDMMLTSDSENYLPETLIFPNDNLTRQITITNIGSLNFDYFVNVEFLGGDIDLCNALIFNSSMNGNLSNGDSHVLNLIASLSSDAHYDLSNKTCEFNVKAYAWQPELNSYSLGFTDSEVLKSSISTGNWIPEEPLPEEESDDYQKVVISEVMWMGSTTNTNDEWIELKNMTNEPIDLTNWTIENALIDHGTYVISGGVIPANGYFLISNYDSANASSSLNVDSDIVTTSISLSNENNGNLILKDNNNVLIDNAFAWASGENSIVKRSMERNLIPNDGIQSENWHSCIDEVCNDSTYWDIHDGDNYGTPKFENHSENDLSINPEILTEELVVAEEVIDDEITENI